MKDPKRNQRIRLLRSNSGYQAGRIYRIVRVDPSDETLVAADENGQEGNWVKWSDCIPLATVSWDWLKSQLPGDVLELLSAFDGLRELTLRDEVRNQILLQLPNLKQRILEAQIALENEEGSPFPGEDDPAALPGGDDPAENAPRRGRPRAA